MEGDVVKDISFVGSGCCISKASDSNLTGEVKDVLRDFDQEVQRIEDLEVAGWAGQQQRDDLLLPELEKRLGR